MLKDCFHSMFLGSELLSFLHIVSVNNCIISQLRIFVHRMFVR